MSEEDKSLVVGQDGIDFWHDCGSSTGFTLSLSSLSLYGVNLTICTKELAGNGGDARIEGIPIFTTLFPSSSSSLISSYNVSRVYDTAIGNTGYRDFVDGYENRSIQAIISKEDWGTGWEVTVCGMDDYYGDGDIELNLEVSFSSLEPLNDSSSYAPTFYLPFINQNEDVVGVEIDVSSYVVSEAVKGISSELEFYLTSQPTSTVYFDFPTSLPFEVYSEPPQLSVSPDNWKYNFNVSILTVDDFHRFSLYIIPVILYSSDTDYM